MKQRLMNVAKCFLMILGVLFLLQLIIFICMVVGITNLSNVKLYDYNKNAIKQIKPIINYVEEYKNKNGVYPEKLDSKKFKIKPNTYFEYNTTKDNHCYTIVVKNKKDTSIKQYQRCSIDLDNSSSDSQSYVEYNK